jgi:hypothetical protein
MTPNSPVPASFQIIYTTVFCSPPILFLELEYQAIESYLLVSHGVYDILLAVIVDHNN